MELYDIIMSPKITQDKTNEFNIIYDTTKTKILYFGK